MIYTTYFANLKNLPKDITSISIAGKCPDWYDGLQFKVLAPKWDFFKVWKETGDNDYYIKCFNEQVLSGLNPKLIVDRLFELAQNDNIALVCYEEPGKFCHRHLVAKWLNDNGIKVNEFGRHKTKF